MTLLVSLFYMAISMGRNNVRYFIEEDYPMIAGWWTAHEWPVLTEDMLPEIGFVAFIDRQPVAASWLVETNTNIAMHEWLVSNPEAKKRDIYEAINALIDTAEYMADKLGYTTLFSSISSRGLKRQFAKRNYIQDNNMTNFTKRLSWQ